MFARWLQKNKTKKKGGSGAGDSRIHKQWPATAGEVFKQLAALRSNIIPDVGVLCRLNRLCTRCFNTDAGLLTIIHDDGVRTLDCMSIMLTQVITLWKT